MINKNPTLGEKICNNCTSPETLCDLKIGFAFFLLSESNINKIFQLDKNISIMFEIYFEVAWVIVTPYGSFITFYRSL